MVRSKLVRFVRFRSGSGHGLAGRFGLMRFGGAVSNTLDSPGSEWLAVVVPLAMSQALDLVVVVREVSHPGWLIPSMPGSVRDQVLPRHFKHARWLFESSAHPFGALGICICIDLLLSGSSLLSLSSTHYQQLNT